MERPRGRERCIRLNDDWAWRAVGNTFVWPLQFRRRFIESMWRYDGPDCPCARDELCDELTKCPRQTNAVFPVWQCIRHCKNRGASGLSEMCTTEARQSVM